MFRIPIWITLFQLIVVKGVVKQACKDNRNCIKLTLTPNELNGKKIILDLPADPKVREEIEKYALDQMKDNLQASGMKIKTSVSFHQESSVGKASSDIKMNATSSAAANGFSLTTMSRDESSNVKRESSDAPSSAMSTAATELPETIFSKRITQSFTSTEFEKTAPTVITEATVVEENEDAYCSGSSGIKGIYPAPYEDSDGILVYCDNVTDGGGWMIIQRRQDGSVDFNRNWTDYVKGFGDPEGEFWMGLNKIHHLTSDGNYELRIDLEDWEGNQTYAKYSKFSIGDSLDKYRLHVSGYSGTNGDSMQNHNQRQFSTSDRDNDVDSSRHCGQVFKGGWWFSRCRRANLNGVYHDQRDGADFYKGIIWKTLKGLAYSLKFSEMKFRRNQDL